MDYNNTLLHVIRELEYSVFLEPFIRYILFLVVYYPRFVEKGWSFYKVLCPSINLMDFKIVKKEKRINKT